LAPEQVTPIALLLAHEDSAVTGRIFEAGGGHVLETRWEHSAGARLPSGFMPEDLQDAWSTAMFTTPGSSTSDRWAGLVSGVPAGLLGRR
jgi:hypothetical protein